jgi:ssDNA-binding Zn-finger/Zn-ribbon topoisomerase 1
LATSSQNNFNRGTTKRNVCGVKGVRWENDRQKWLVRCCINRKLYNLGRYSDLDDAKKAYIDFAKQHHGEFLNV